MTYNWPGPYGIRFFYTVTPTGFAAIEHKLELQCRIEGTPNPGTDWANINILQKDNTPYALATASAAVITALQPEFSSSDVTFDRVELWKYQDQSLNADFISADTVGLAGTAVLTTKVCTQSIMTFRTEEGGIMRVTLMEDIYSGTFPAGYADLSAETQAVIDYILASPGNQLFVGRDTSYPISFVRYNPSQNEAMFRKRYRP